MFEPESSVASVYFLGTLARVPILLIKIIIGVLILILFVIALHPNSNPFLFLPIIFLNLWPDFLFVNSFLPWDKLIPQIQHRYSLFGFVVAADDRVLRYACIALIVSFICANCAITA